MCWRCPSVRSGQLLEASASEWRVVETWFGHRNVRGNVFVRSAPVIWRLRQAQPLAQRKTSARKAQTSRAEWSEAGGKGGKAPLAAPSPPPPPLSPQSQRASSAHLPRELRSLQ